VKECSGLITPELVIECGGDTEMIRSMALTEGAKIDFLLKNFLKEGEDYRGLKKDLREIIKANDLDESKLTTGHKGFLHVCKRILQVLADIDVPFMAGQTGVRIAANIKLAKTLAATVGGKVSIPAIVVRAIVSFVISFLINRLWRLLYDHIEFSALKKDAEEIKAQLEDNAKKSKNDSVRKHYEKQAERVQDMIDKYSKKSKK